MATTLPGPSDGTSRFKAATNIVPMLIWMAGVDRHCDWFNEPWLQFTGRSMAQELGDGWREAVHPEDIERCIGIYGVSFDAQVPFDMDYRLRRHDGVYRWMLDQGVPHHAADGSFSGYVGCCLDVDDRRAIEDRLALRTEALRLSERRRDRLLTSMVDELDASLATARRIADRAGSARGAVDARAASIDMTQALQQQLTRLLGEARRAARSVVSAAAPHRQASTVGALLSIAVEALPPAMRRQADKLQIAIAEASPSLNIDPQLPRLVGRLFEQALHCLATASSVAVGAQVDEAGSALSIRIECHAGIWTDRFVSIALTLFADLASPVGAPVAAVGSSSPNATPGVSVFVERDRAVTFVFGSPWVDGANDPRG